MAENFCNVGDLEVQNFKGPCTQQLDTWVLGNSHFSTGVGQVYDS